VLFERSVTGASPTAVGERLLEPARRMAEWAGELERAAPGADHRPRGVVRITAPPGVAWELLAPLAGLLQKELPLVRLEVQARVQYADLARREADLALRTRAPTQRDLVEIERLEFDVDAFATPELIARLPRKPKLTDIPFIAWAPPFEAMVPNPQLEQLIPGFTPVFASDDYLVQLRAAEAGVGAMFLGDVRHRFAPRSTLKRLKLELGAHARGSIHLVAARSALDVARVRAVADILAREMRRVR